MNAILRTWQFTCIYILLHVLVWMLASVYYGEMITIIPTTGPPRIGVIVGLIISWYGSE